MKTIEIDVLSDTPNSPVVKMQNRKFPAVVMQGDTLKTLCGLADALCTLTATAESDDLNDLACELRDHLAAHLTNYEHTLKAHHLELPYSAD